MRRKPGLRSGGRWVVLVLAALLLTTASAYLVYQSYFGYAVQIPPGALEIPRFEGFSNGTTSSLLDRWASTSTDWRPHVREALSLSSYEGTLHLSFTLSVYVGDLAAYANFNRSLSPGGASDDLFWRYPVDVYLGHDGHRLYLFARVQGLTVVPSSTREFASPGWFLWALWNGRPGYRGFTSSYSGPLLPLMPVSERDGRDFTIDGLTVWANAPFKQSYVLEYNVSRPWGAFDSRKDEWPTGVAFPMGQESRYLVVVPFDKLPGPSPISQERRGLLYLDFGLQLTDLVDSAFGLGLYPGGENMNAWCCEENFLLFVYHDT